jgi:hypothetical protein
MEKAPINIYLRDFLDLKISQDRLLNERFAPANLYQKLNYYGGKAAISLVAPCIVVTLLVVVEDWLRLSLICTGFDIGTIFAKSVN